MLTDQSQYRINNETKLQPSTNIEFDGYHTERKDRNSRGGGVAILIHSDIHYESLNTLDHYNLELVLVKITTQYKTLHIITIYVPPRKSATDVFLCQNFFDDLDKLRPFILNGDLNSHSKNWYCTTNNKNGSILETLLAYSRFNLVNNRTPTHKDPKSDSESIIDLSLISSDLKDKFINYFVVTKNRLYGHFPTITTLDLPTTKIKPVSTSFTVKVSDWPLFTSSFSSSYNRVVTLDSPASAPVLTSSLEASTASTKTTSRKLNKKTVPARPRNTQQIIGEKSRK